MRITDSTSFNKATRRTAVIAVAVFSTLTLSGCERAKTRLDREVDRLCAIDGGVHIYETVRLPKENFGPDGELFPQFKGKSNWYGPDYRSQILKESLTDGDPSLIRQRVQVIRTNDGKVLGEIISYARTGGDFYGPWESSGHSCNLGVTPKDFDIRIFLPQGELP